MIDPQTFLVFEDLTESVDAIESVVAANVEHALSLIDQKTVPTRQSVTCTCVPKECPCANHCFPQLPAYSIFDLARIGSEKARNLYDQGIRTIAALPNDFKLTEAQASQVKVTRSGKPLIKKAAVQKALQELVYPLYFLDYETFASAVPLFDGYKPYQQMVFQYSLHILRSPKGKLEHREYLAEKLCRPGSGCHIEVTRTHWR